MKEVYKQSPQMGDADSLEPRLEEVKQILQKLDNELKKNQVYITNKDNMQCTINIQQCVNKPVCLYSQVWLKETDNRLSENGSRRHSGGCALNASGGSSLKQLENHHPASRERYQMV